MPDLERLKDVRAYYEKILPFYEKESIARAHLDFWTALARRWRPARSLEVGSGLGRITQALARQAPAVGIDISVEMLRRAARRLPLRSRARFVAADLRRVAFGLRFDLIVAPSDPFCHLLTAADRRRALRAVADQLSDRGHFVLEGLYRPGDRVERPERRIRCSGGVLSIGETWLPIERRHNLWRARYRYRDRRPGMPDRVREASFVARAWDPERLEPLLASCSLALEELWGDFDHRPFGKEAERIIVVAKRRARILQRRHR